MLPGTFNNLLLGGAVVPGSQTYSTAGTYSFKVPAYNKITFTLWGGGAAGGWGYGAGQNGNNTTVSFSGSSLVAGGGTGGYSGYYRRGIGAGGPGGTASGGNVTNINGGDGIAGYVYTNSTSSWANGGASPNGGAGGNGNTQRAPGPWNGSPGFAPGGGGGGGYSEDTSGSSHNWQGGGGGGAGAYVVSTYTSATGPTQGSTISITVGDGGAGAGNGASGAAGQIIVAWA
jgi:hypothetical protein